MNDTRVEGNTIIHEPNNYMKIEEVYCYVSVDEKGNEGIVAQTMELAGSTVMMPFVAADKVMMERLDPLAHKIAKKTGKKIRLIRMSSRETLMEFI